MTMMTYEEAMDDVHTRFILNLPDDELRSAPRIFFQLEQAWWFYDDFICDGAAAAAASTTTTKEEVLPRYKHVKPFSYAMFQFSPLLQPMLPNFDTMYDEFAKYKRSISTYGTILLNEEATKVALVRPWQSKSWTFPGGKVNQNESAYDAACRETYEETGFDPMVEPSVQPPPNSNSHSSSLTSSSSSLRREEAYKLTYTERESNKKRTCYICRGVPLNFPFEPVARKEVSEIKWFDISTLPKQKTYAVLPFYNQLREWIRKDNKARGMIVDSSYNSSSRGSSSRRGSGNNDDGDNNINDDGDNNDDGGLAPFFSNDGKAPWEQDEERGDGDGEQKSTTEKNNSSSNNSVGSNPGPSAKGQHKHEKQQHHQKQTQQQGRDGSRGKPKSQNRRSTPPRAASASSSRGDSTGRGRRRGGGGGGESGEETTTCAKASPVVAVVVSASDPLVKSALATPGESRRWTEDEMFAANEKLSGRKITYDGNPHEFAAGGWGSGIVRNDKDVDGGAVVVDPHAFHIVGGAFMNSSSESAPSSLIAPPPEVSKLQPLVNARAMTPGSVAGSGDEGDDGLQLTPFFSDDGRAPWEEHNARAPKEVTPLSGLVQGPPLERRNSKGLALLNRLRRGGSANNDDEVGEEGGGAGEFHVVMMADVKDTTDFDDWFMTDKEITAKSQSKKLLMMSRVSNPTPVRGHESVPQAMSSPRDSQKVTGEDSPRIICPNEHLVWMQKWAQQLPQTGPTKLFGDFRLDVDSILNVAMTVVHKGPK